MFSVFKWCVGFYNHGWRVEKLKLVFTNSKFVIADKMIDYIERNSYLEKYTHMEFQSNTTQQLLSHAPRMYLS